MTMSAVGGMIAGIYSTNLRRGARPACRCEYCFNVHHKPDCPTCGAPAPKVSQPDSSCTVRSESVKSPAP